MAPETLKQRSRERAQAERLHTFKLSGQPAYLVKSRHLEPGSMHVVRIDSRGRVSSCDCPAWHYRMSCTHAAAVERRLERERKTPGGGDASLPESTHNVVTAARRASEDAPISSGVASCCTIYMPEEW
jgi:hypothetical protein